MMSKLQPREKSLSTFYAHFTEYLQQSKK